MRIGVVGSGLVATRAVRELAGAGAVDVVLLGASERRSRELIAALGSKVRSGDDDDVDVVVLATPDATQVELARHHVERGHDVIATTGSLDSVQQLFELDAMVHSLGRQVVVGAGFSPGLSTTLAVHAAALFDQVLEVHTAVVGWGGPVCEDDYRAAARGPGREWRDGDWGELRSGGSKELLWFPDPIGARDCGAGSWGESLVIHAVLPDASRVITRGGLPRRELLTRTGRRRATEPLGAIRVEVRGIQAGRTAAVIYGAMDHPASATAVVAATTAVRVAERHGGSAPAVGVVSVASLAEPRELLAEWAARGIRSCVFEGTAA